MVTACSQDHLERMKDFATRTIAHAHDFTSPSLADMEVKFEFHCKAKLTTSTAKVPEKASQLLRELAALESD